MGLKNATKLCVGVLILGAVRCAGPAPRHTSELERRNRELERRVNEERAEVTRLQKFLKEDDDTEILSDAEDIAKVPLMVLKPEVEKKVEENSEDEDLSKRNTIASSHFESMTLYQQGVQQMANGRYDQAVSAFTGFLRKNPEHVYGDRAQFWIGECYFRGREFGLAVVAFNLVVSQYPHSVKVPEAMYRAALAHLEMGHTRPAQGLLRDLLRQYPADGVVSSASKKLAEISMPNRG